MDDWSISVGVEDKYVIFGLNKPNSLLPESSALDGLLASFAPLAHAYQPILDLTGVEDVTNDVVGFAEQWAEYKASIIINRSQKDVVDRWPKRLPQPIPIRHREWEVHEISLAHFLDDDDVRNYSLQDQVARTVALAGSALPTREEWDLVSQFDGISKELYGDYESFKEHYELEHQERRYQYPIRSDDERLIVGTRALRNQLRSFGRNSLMSQLALFPGASGSITPLPYHANALYETETARSRTELFITRPAKIAHRTADLFAGALAEFRLLLGNSNTSEHEYQRFFEKNPSLFYMLGFKSIYPKVILEREDGTSMSPDFMVEPFDSEFWDILELKKPDVPLVVGARDRMDFSSQVHQLGAQLREYGAYFDEAKNRKIISDRYGFTAYKPRLVGIIGDDYNVSDKLQLKRVMTQYDDTRVMTFSQLERMAAHRLLL